MPGPPFQVQDDKMTKARGKEGMIPKQNHLSDPFLHVIFALRVSVYFDLKILDRVSKRIGFDTFKKNESR